MAGKRGEGVLLSLFLHPSTASPRIKSASNRLRGRHCSMGGGWDSAEDDVWGEGEREEWR